MKKILSVALIFILSLNLVATTLAAPVEYGEEIKDMPDYVPNISFSDVDSSHWAYQYILEMADRDIIKGYPDGKFRPNNKVTRAQLAKIMVLATGLTPKKVNYSSYADIPVSDWASPFAETAKDYLTGYRLQNGSYVFRPNAPALREDVAVALVKLKGYDKRLADRSMIKDMFSDYEGISESAKDYVALAVENGIFSGKSNGTIDPQGTLTRAQAAAIIWRAFQYGDDNKETNGEPNNPEQPSSNSPAQTPAQQPTNNPSSGTTKPAPTKQTAKFSVDTLAGGIGKGDVDGPVYKAKINQIDSMIVDKNNNIFFLDNEVKKIRKFNVNAGTVETFKLINEEFDNELPAKYNDEYTLRGSFEPSKLAYNYATDTLFALGKVSYKHKWDNFWVEVATLYQLTGDMKLIDSFRTDISDAGPKFVIFPDRNRAIYGIHTGFDSKIFESGFGGEVSILSSEQEKTGVEIPYDKQQVDIILSENNLYIFNASSLTLSNIQLFPRQIHEVKKIDNFSKVDSVVAYNNKFYYTVNANVYEIDTNGNISTFVKGSDLKYNDGNSIEKIKLFNFDSQGNIILYDDKNKAIRRINLN